MGLVIVEGKGQLLGVNLERTIVTNGTLLRSCARATRSSQITWEDLLILYDRNKFIWQNQRQYKWRLLWATASLCKQNMGVPYSISWIRIRINTVNGFRFSERVFWIWNRGFRIGETCQMTSLSFIFHGLTLLALFTAKRPSFDLPMIWNGFHCEFESEIDNRILRLLAAPLSNIVQINQHSLRGCVNQASPRWISAVDPRWTAWDAQ